MTIPTTTNGYPFPIPPNTGGAPAMSDKEALDYLASTVLGDHDSSAGYVYEAAALTVMRTGRTIQATYDA